MKHKIYFLLFIGGLFSACISNFDEPKKTVFKSEPSQKDSLPPNISTKGNLPDSWPSEIIRAYVFPDSLKGKIIDHEAEVKRVIDDGGPDYFYNPMAQGIKVLSASSTLQGDYDISRINDGDWRTAWVEGGSGYGIGVYFEVKAKEFYPPNWIYNGYQKSPELWRNNSRVKSFRIYVDGEPYGILELLDEMVELRFDLGLDMKEGYRPIIRFEIHEVFPGKKWKDVAVSEIEAVAG
tara:strand:+ start:847 stop:1554 length:708 start_codon:yes stop_codon:yes gene_type:complete